MKIFIGILSAVIILTGATLTVLALWDIQPISLSIILRSGATIAIVCVTFFVLWLIRVLFFKKDLFNSNKGK
ncbi:MULTISPECIES: hypothetical protein [Dysgonomonas]|uniref:Uncharacterized protein n=2 Tax=Dysgonomonas TaxID=156973 RepID=F5ISU0_9BACT|nr:MULTISPECIES: hypothetical protein [Dysgonomonas]EGK02035.1 hypothetical protein HMPREF9455_00157 [Dysgonomonas gadei ATCC BAA-286]MBF0647812.1 hypothetical protein [Dysgonomonas sp. GY75]